MTLIKDFFSWIFTAFITAVLLTALIAGIFSAGNSYRFLHSQNQRISGISAEIEALKAKQKINQEENEALAAAKNSAPAWNMFEYADLSNHLLRTEYNDVKFRMAIAQKAAELAQISSLDGSDRFLKSFKQNFFFWLPHLLFLIFLFPLLRKIIMFYIVAGFVETRKPVRALPADPYLKTIRSFQAGLTIRFPLAGNQKLYLRAGEWGKKRTNLSAHVKMFWNLRYPLVSAAADLIELVELKAVPGKQGSVSVSAPAPDLFSGRIDLAGNSGIVIRPRYLIGVTDTVKIRTKWSFNLHNIISGRMRQVILYGNGSVLIAGSWGIELRQYSKNCINRIEDNLVLGYEAAAEYALSKTETFWHYLRGRASLFDLQIRNGAFLTQNNVPRRNRNESVFERIFANFLNALGNFLGL